MSNTSAHAPNNAPCKFDHNGECLICDCWPSTCAWNRFMAKDYTYESKDELELMFKDYVRHSPMIKED